MKSLNVVVINFYKASRYTHELVYLVTLYINVIF